MRIQRRVAAGQHGVEVLLLLVRGGAADLDLDAHAGVARLIDIQHPAHHIGPLLAAGEDAQGERCLRLCRTGQQGCRRQAGDNRAPTDCLDGVQGPFSPAAITRRRVYLARTCQRRTDAGKGSPNARDSLEPHAADDRAERRTPLTRRRPQREHWLMPRALPSFACFLALLTVLVGCAPPPAALTAPASLRPPPYPAETRARMLRLLDGEWREWGARTLDARARPPSEAEGPLAERHPAAFSKLLAYWSAVGWQDTIDRNKRAFSMGIADTCTSEERATGGRDTIWGCLPWSAAFVSFIMRATGIDQAEFPPSAAHATYVDALIQHSDRWGPRATFVAHEIDGYAPASGDMICYDRSRTARLATLAQRRAEPGVFRPMHCDIVVGTAPGEVVALGGNVAQAVTAVRYATDPAGRLRRSTRTWFAVFENRMGVH